MQLDDTLSHNTCSVREENFRLHVEKVVVSVCMLENCWEPVLGSCLHECFQVQDKFRLDLSDEQAVQYMQNLIDVSVTATFAALVEQMHKFAQVLHAAQFHFYSLGASIFSVGITDVASLLSEGIRFRLFNDIL